MTKIKNPIIHTGQTLRVPNNHNEIEKLKNELEELINKRAKLIVIQEKRKDELLRIIRSIDDN